MFFHGSATLVFLVQGELGMPEGMAVSKEGNIFLSGTNGVQVRRAWSASSSVYPKMELLDISLTKVLESFVPCYSQSLPDFKENPLFSGFKNLCKKIR
jgi:hypothetical protein